MTTPTAANEGLSSPTALVSPRLLPEVVDAQLLAEIVETGESLARRGETMFRALAVLYEEQILEEPTIRSARKQREMDGKHHIERYKQLLAEYKARAGVVAASDPRRASAQAGVRLADAILVRVEFMERAYLHEKQRLKISTDLALLVEEKRRLENVLDRFRGSRVAYSAQERLGELARTELLLTTDLQRVDLERQAMTLETEILVAETLRDRAGGADDREAERQLKTMETKLGRLRAQLASKPPRPTARRPTRRRS